GAVAEMPLQRFQDQLEKIMEGTAAFNIHGRAVAHGRPIAAANGLAAAPKDFAQSVCKHLISAIVSAPALPVIRHLLQSRCRGLLDVRVGWLLDFSRKCRDLISPDVSPVGSGGLVAALIVAGDFPLDRLR